MSAVIKMMIRLKPQVKCSATFTTWVGDLWNNAIIIFDSHWWRHIYYCWEFLYWSVALTTFLIAYIKRRLSSKVFSTGFEVWKSLEYLHSIHNKRRSKSHFLRKKFTYCQHRNNRWKHFHINYSVTINKLISFTRCINPKVVNLLTGNRFS